MAKLTLQIFGMLAVVPGICIILAGLSSNDAALVPLSLALGSGFFLAAAPLLGFARVISLLERIEINTRREGAPMRLD